MSTPYQLEPYKKPCYRCGWRRTWRYRSARNTFKICLKCYDVIGDLKVDCTVAEMDAFLQP